ncbi:MAG: metallopeptidase TldD-related protein [Actinomycetota bacterium]
MTSAVSTQLYFDEAVGWATDALQADEVLLATTAGEVTDFIRFTRGDVRQAGSVQQMTLSLDLISGRRHAEGSVMLSNDPAIDRPRVGDLVARLREQRALVPDDPYLSFNTDPVSSEAVRDRTLLDPADALGRIRDAAGGEDFVGIYAAGDIFSGFANSLGQRNWHQTATFNLDWSFHLRADKAAKNAYAGFTWDDAAFERRIDWSRRQLEALGREPVDLAPGGYRTYLAPAALQELVDLWCWGGFSERSHRTMQTPLLRMVTEDAALDPSVRVSEDIGGGVAPNFQEAGFVRPDEVVLIDDGTYRDTLVSPRSAREYGLATNGASSFEDPEALAIAPGDVPIGQSVERLGTGLHVGNLWYTNFSDRAACRTTGMTRFATFWAEDGEIVAPVNVMRFDDTIYSLFGDAMVGLTDEAEVMLDSSTYQRRSTSSTRVPGLLVEEMAFTL